ncbi:MAG: pitrilysin family protein, partial [Candidatus Limnocylindrales bacterium]
LDNGLTVIGAHLAGRPLIAAQLILEGGAGLEPSDLSGVSTLLARALPEGTEVRDAVAFVEATERLGAEIHADAGWETLVATAEVPRRHLEPALTLMAEMLLRPALPANEVDRLREERINDLLQAAAEPRRRVERAFAATVYAPGVPYGRLLGGDETTVPRLDREALEARHATIVDPGEATMVVAGDLTDVDLAAHVEAAFGAWRARGTRAARGRRSDDAGPRRVGVRDRPGSAQSEVRVGHVGLPRRIDDFHAVAVMSVILGGLFNSRLQRLLREDRGYTYSIGAAFDFRRSAGPFAVRTAVQTEVTGPAIVDILGELDRIREAPITEAELREARDFLIGVFPLRFEVAAQVVGAISGLVVHGLPDDELDRYRPAVAALTPDEVHDAAVRHVRPDDASIVLVADAEQVLSQLEAAGIGPVEVVSEAVPAEDAA